MTVKVACVQYRPDFLAGWTAFADKLDSLVGAAVKAGAGMVVMPEYAGMEIASLLPPAEAGDLVRSIAGMQELLPEYLAIHGQIARRHRCLLAAGSIPVHVDGAYRNRVHVFGPSGLMGMQDKLVMTRFEREEWGISAGNVVTVFEAPFGRFAVAVCYDVEFPAIVATMVEAGARLVVVPSCTDTVAGVNRVRLTARARAVEHQIYVAQAPLVGQCDWSPAIDVNLGSAAIFTPCDTGFPADGVLAEAVSEAPQVVIGELDFALVDRVREEGKVLNYRHHRDVAERVPFAVDRVGDHFTST